MSESEEVTTRYFAIVSAQVAVDGSAARSFTYSNTYDVAPHVTERALYKHVLSEAAEKNDCRPDEAMVTFYRAVPDSRAVGGGAA